MGCRILEEKNYGRAVLYCSTVGVAFGPVFASTEEASAFLEWLGSDPRLMTESELTGKYNDFLGEPECDPKTHNANEGRCCDRRRR